MKSVSRFALALAVASMSLTSAAGWAADEKPKKEKGKKEKAPEPLKLSLSKEFQAVYNPAVQEYTKKKDDPAAQAALKAAWPNIKAAIMNDDDRYQAGNLAQVIGVQTKDTPLRVEAVDLLIASTRTPANERATAYYIKGAIGFESKDWPTAIDNMKIAYDQGFRQNLVEGGLEMLVGEALAQQGKYPEALDWMKKSQEGSKVAGAKPLPSNFLAKAANFALRTKDYQYIGPWFQDLVRANPGVDYWHDGLMQAYKYLPDLDSQEVLDLMRLLRANGAMKYEQNYAAYVTDSVAAFYPIESKAVLEEGFAKGTISRTNLTYKGRYEDVNAKLQLDPFSVAQLDKDIASAKTGYEAAVSGDIALSVGEYAKAKASYENALSLGNIVDNKERKDLTERTTMRLGIAKVKLGDLAGAKADFAKIVSPGRKAVADYWLIYVEQLEKAPAPAPAG